MTKTTRLAKANKKNQELAAEGARKRKTLLLI